MRLLKIIKKIMAILALFIMMTIPEIIIASDAAHNKHGSAKKQPTHEELLKKEISRHFHNTEGELINPPQIPVGYSEAKSFCMYCHGSFPHITNIVVRAIFNFHKIFIACEACHYKARLNTDKTGYRWYDGTDRTIRDLKKLEEAQAFSGSSPAKQLTDKDIYKKYGFKISPYTKEDGKFVMMVALLNDPFPQEFLKVQGKLNPDQQAGMKAKIHGNIDPLGSDCIDCHKIDSQLPFKSLGFTETRIKDLLQTEAAGLFKYYSRDPKYKGMTFKIRKLSGIWGMDFKKPE